MTVVALRATGAASKRPYDITGAASRRRAQRRDDETGVVRRAVPGRQFHNAS